MSRRRGTLYDPASETCDRPCAVAERFAAGADLVEDRQVQVGQRGWLAQLEVLAALVGAVAAADQDRRQRMAVVAIAVRHVRTVEEHRVVEQRAVAIGN